MVRLKPFRSKSVSFFVNKQLYFYLNNIMEIKIPDFSSKHQIFGLLLLIIIVLLWRLPELIQLLKLFIKK